MIPYAKYFGRIWYDADQCWSTQADSRAKEKRQREFSRIYLLLELWRMSRWFDISQMDSSFVTISVRHPIWWNPIYSASKQENQKSVSTRNKIRARGIALIAAQLSIWETNVKRRRNALNATEVGILQGIVQVKSDQQKKCGMPSRHWSWYVAYAYEDLSSLKSPCRKVLQNCTGSETLQPPCWVHWISTWR